MTDRSWQSVRRQVIPMANGVVLTLRPEGGAKFRHWQAHRRGELIGEWKTWQVSEYVKQTEGYGRGGGKYVTWMERSSWLDGYNGNDELDTKRLFNEWKALCRKMAMTPIRRMLKRPVSSEPVS